MGNQDSKMTVTIDRLVGEDFMLEVVEGDTVASVKQMIFALLNIEPNQQRLTYEGEMMMDDKTMDFYNIPFPSVSGGYSG